MYKKNSKLFGEGGLLIFGTGDYSFCGKVVGVTGVAGVTGVTRVTGFAGVTELPGVIMSLGSQ